MAKRMYAVKFVGVLDEEIYKDFPDQIPVSSEVIQHVEDALSVLSIQPSWAVCEVSGQTTDPSSWKMAIEMSSGEVEVTFQDLIDAYKVVHA